MYVSNRDARFVARDRSLRLAPSPIQKKGLADHRTSRIRATALGGGFNPSTQQPHEISCWRFAGWPSVNARSSLHLQHKTPQWRLVCRVHRLNRPAQAVLARSGKQPFARRLNYLDCVHDGFSQRVDVAREARIGCRADPARDLVGFAKRGMSENAIAGIQSSPRLDAHQMGKLARVVDMSEPSLALLHQFHGFCDTPLSSPKLT